VIPATITCVECGGTARRQLAEPEMGWEEGDVVTYACPDCNHRMDIVLEVDDVEDDVDW
jgi:predicted nucleic acid-binding Zn ribbon protein